MMKIKSIEINSFRGISKNLTIEFPNKNNRHLSLVILGDNGSGKSSIVDAIEFCLQGQIAQNFDLSDKNKPSIFSFSNPKIVPTVKVTFENDESFERNIIDDEQGYLTNDRQASKYFSISPFVLRRNDILRFIETPDAEKTLVFSNYLRDKDIEWFETPKDELKRLQNERLDSKDRRDKLIEQLAKILRVGKRDIPYNNRDFRAFVREKIYLGLTTKEIRESNKKFQFNEKAILLAEETLREIENTRRIKNKINEYSIENKIKKFPSHLLPQLNQFLINVGYKLTESFTSISPLSFIKSIELVYEERNVLALKIKIYLKNGRVCSPQEILSEANLDLLALLFYIAFMQESAERGQSKLLVLDDVLQSVDSTIRVSFISYLLENFKDWQLIVTAHDRLWHRQLTDLMNSQGHTYFNIEILNWTFESGPKIFTGVNNGAVQLEQLIENGSLVPICSQAGLLLEEICDFLSINLEISVKRKYGDRYTIGDLWPGIMKKLKTTNIMSDIEEVNKWLHLRNIIGAHYNDWSVSLSLGEAKKFGEAILSLYNTIRCEHCGTIVKAAYGFNFISCKCSKKMFTL